MSETTYRFESCRGHFSRRLLAHAGVGLRTRDACGVACATPRIPRLARLGVHQNTLAKIVEARWGFGGRRAGAMCFGPSLRSHPRNHNARAKMGLYRFHFGLSFFIFEKRPKMGKI